MNLLKLFFFSSIILVLGSSKVMSQIIDISYSPVEIDWALLETKHRDFFTANPQLLKGSITFVENKTKMTCDKGLPHIRSLFNIFYINVGLTTVVKCEKSKIKFKFSFTKLENLKLKKIVFKLKKK